VAHPDGGTRLIRLLYSGLVSIAVWTILAPLTAVRIALGRSPLEALRQRLGSPGSLRKSPRRFLLHAVSLGEMSAAEALVSALLEADSEATVLLSAGNRQAFEKGSRIAAGRGRVDGPVLLPWDRFGVLLTWLRRLEPVAVAVVETEIWPNLFFACRRLQIPLAIVSGRLEASDVARYRLARPFFRKVLSCAAWIGAQDAAEAERFEAIGAPPGLVTVAGNLKADVPDADPASSSARIERLSGGDLLLLAASTHWPEERSLVRVFFRLRDAFPSLRLVLAPRDSGRAARLARMVRRRRLRAFPWSSALAGANWDVLILDEAGWLLPFYRRADIAFVGGTLADRGGHNLFEPAAGGRPIVVGPHTENFQDVAERLERAGALARVADELSLEDCLRALLEDPARRAAMGRAAFSVATGGRGSSRLYAESLRRLLADRAPVAKSRRPRRAQRR